MTHNVEVKIECKGDAAGTLGWFSAMMARSEFVIKNGKTGSPAIFLKTTEDVKMANGENYATYKFLCKKYDQREDPYGYRITDDGYMCEIPESINDCTGFSDYPLTPACREAVKEMIDKAKDIFAEWWEGQ